jgi:hypothetical protein
MASRGPNRCRHWVACSEETGMGLCHVCRALQTGQKKIHFMSVLGGLFEMPLQQEMNTNSSRKICNHAYDRTNPSVIFLTNLAFWKNRCLIWPWRNFLKSNPWVWRPQDEAKLVQVGGKVWLAPLNSVRVRREGARKNWWRTTQNKLCQVFLLSCQYFLASTCISLTALNYRPRFQNSLSWDQVLVFAKRWDFLPRSDMHSCWIRVAIVPAVYGQPAAYWQSSRVQQKQ